MLPGSRLHTEAMWMRTLLQRMAHRCPVHDVPSVHRIRALELELELEQSAVEGDWVDLHYNPALVDCGSRWCRQGRQ